jgi:hypothetical protein
MAAKFIANVASDGSIYGFNATDKLGFFGTTPVVRPSVSANATNSATTISVLNLLISAVGNGSGGLGLITAGG